MISRLRSATGTDEFGDLPSGEPVKTEIEGAFTAPRSSSDVDGRGRDGVIVGLDLFAPYGTDLVASDRVDIDGVVWRIDGEVGSWKHPFTGWEAGITCALTRGAG